jgi:hypothetical protein
VDPLSVLLLVAASSGCDVPAADRQRQAALPYEAFDSAPAPTGWRALNARGCTDSAVALLRAYRSANAAKLAPEQRRESAFHIAQAYAFAGRGAEALPYFVEAGDSDAPDEWGAYVAAHVAFFRHDRVALADARKRYAAVSQPGSMRLKFIDGMLRCPDKSYMEAVHCAM